jgi:hypothetical protein
MKSNNNNNDDDDDDDDDDDNNNAAMGSVHARGDTFLTFGLKALTDTNTSRLARRGRFISFPVHPSHPILYKPCSCEGVVKNVRYLTQIHWK